MTPGHRSSAISGCQQRTAELCIEEVPSSDLKNTAPTPASLHWLRAIQRSRETELMVEVDGWLSEDEHLPCSRSANDVVTRRRLQPRHWAEGR